VRHRVIGGWFLSFLVFFPSILFACNRGREEGSRGGGGRGYTLFFLSMLSYVRAVSKAGKREREGERRGREGGERRGREEGDL